MQQTDQVYETLIRSRHYFVETSLVICDNTIPLAMDTDEVIEQGYRENSIVSLQTNINVFSGNTPKVGCCSCGEVDATILYPANVIPKMARVTPYIRLVSTTDETVHSDWYRKGVYFIDTREVTKNDDGIRMLTFHGYDALLKANDNYQWSEQASPTDIQAVNAIAEKIGVLVDPRTTAIITNAYTVVAPIGFTMTETLGFIAGAYGGNFIINELGKLQLICLWDLPKETYFLTNEDFDYITFGGYRINLGVDA